MVPRLWRMGGAKGCTQNGLLLKLFHGGYGDFGAWKPGFDEEKFHMEERIKELKGEMKTLWP